MTRDQRIRGVGGSKMRACGSGPARATVRRLRRNLGEDADDPAYIFTKRRVGYWIEKGET